LAAVGVSTDVSTLLVNQKVCQGRKWEKI
jgi:hypothetical protein